VYIFIHKELNKIYIGSSLNIGRRLYGYFSKYMLKKKNKTMVICRAILKYGHSNFSFGILEYCDQTNRIERENVIDILLTGHQILRGEPYDGKLSRTVLRAVALR